MHAPSPECGRVLAESKHFASLSEELVRAMLGRMVELAFEPGQAIIQQDDPGSSLLVVIEGAARVRVRDGGKTHDVGSVGRGDVLGEMALVTGARRSADVVAETPCRALALAADDFHRLARENPQLSVVLTHLIADRLGGEGRDILGNKVLEGYRILRSVGRGAMSVVYEAEDAENGRRVALKMMSHRLVYNPAAATRFKEEAVIGETLEHENIVRLYSRFSAYGTHFLVMEFCDGPGPNDLLEKRGPLDEPLTRAIIGQVASALCYVHGRGLIHRDVKASNVRLTRGGLAKLMDFGLAKPTLKLGDRTLTHELTLVGTPIYMAPEQFDDAPLDQRVDVYALGCLAYKLLTNERPFKAGSIAKLIKEKARFVLPRRETIGQGVSAEMHAFLETSLRADPGERLATLEGQVGWAAPIDVSDLSR